MAGRPLRVLDLAAEADGEVALWGAVAAAGLAHRPGDAEVVRSVRHARQLGLDLARGHECGVDVPPRDILDKAREVQADIVGLSSLMTTSMPYMKECVELRDGFGLKNDFTVIVGGAPITAEYSAEIGADAFGNDAIEAVEKCLALLDRPATG